jgi:hypothetical protein
MTTTRKRTQMRTPATSGFVTINIRPESRAALKLVTARLTGVAGRTVTLSEALQALSETVDLEAANRWMESNRS